MTLEQLVQLGRELKYLGLNKHLAKCRELYVVVRDGRGKAEWSLEHAAELAGALQLKPNPLGVLCRGALCPTCCTPDSQPNIAWRTITHLDDRYVQQCTRCGGKWVVRLDRSSLVSAPCVGCFLSAQGGEEGVVSHGIVGSPAVPEQVRTRR